MPNPQVNQAWTAYLEPILKTYFLDSYKSIVSKIPDVFSVENSKKLEETYQTSAGIGNFKQFNGVIMPTSSLDAGYTTKIKNVEWALAVDIQYMLWQTAQYPIFKSMMRDMAVSAKRTKEKTAFDIFNNAFNTTNVGGDGLALCSASHVDPSGAVQSNRGTSALSYASYVAARTAMKKFKDMAGEPFFSQPDMLLVPTDLEVTAIEIAESNGKPDTPNNNISAVNRMWKPKIVVSEYLEDQNNWFLLDSVVAKNHLHFQNLTNLQLFKDQSTSSLIMRMAGYYACGAGFSDWRAVYGSEVS